MDVWDHLHIEHLINWRCGRKGIAEQMGPCRTSDADQMPGKCARVRQASKDDHARPQASQGNNRNTHPSASDGCLQHTSWILVSSDKLAAGTPSCKQPRLNRKPQLRRTQKQDRGDHNISIFWFNRAAASSRVENRHTTMRRMRAARHHILATLKQRA